MVAARVFIAVAIVAAAFLSHAADEPAVVENIITNVLANAAKLKAACPDAVPMAFWDFDGTIIKGDVSEGLEENGVQRYAGLIERTVKNGFSTVYKGEEGWLQYRDHDYPRLCTIGRWLGWPYNAQLLAGSVVADLDAFCADEFKRVYAKWFFASSVKILRALEAAGVENYIVSASPEAFVRNAAVMLNLPRERFRGIRVAENAGRITTEVIYPIPFGEGKVENVRMLVLARPHGVAIAAFGNSYFTDGAFLCYVATSPLPGGARGTAVMINGGKVVPNYTEHFCTVNFDKPIGE